MSDIDEDKLMMSEDVRLMIIAYVIVQSKCHKIFPLLLALQDFVDDQIYEECAPLATFESAIRVIEYEFREKCLENVDFSCLKPETDAKEPLPENSLDLLRFSHAVEVMEGSFLFSKPRSNSDVDNVPETRQTYMQCHRNDIADLKLKQNIRLTELDN